MLYVLLLRVCRLREDETSSSDSRLYRTSYLILTIKRHTVIMTCRRGASYA